MEAARSSTQCDNNLGNNTVGRCRSFGASPYAVQVVTPSLGDAFVVAFAVSRILRHGSAGF